MFKLVFIFSLKLMAIVGLLDSKACTGDGKMIYAPFGKRYDPSHVRVRCYCGTEYGPPPVSEAVPPERLPGCPTCGRIFYTAISFDSGAWQSYVDFKIEWMTKLLDDPMEHIPPEIRDSHRQLIRRQVGLWRDGSWKQEWRDKIAGLRQTLVPASLDRFPIEQRESQRRDLEEAIKFLQEELEAGGDNP